MRGDKRRVRQRKREGNEGCIPKFRRGAAATPVWCLAIDMQPQFNLHIATLFRLHGEISLRLMYKIDSPGSINSLRTYIVEWDAELFEE